MTMFPYKLNPKLELSKAFSQNFVMSVSPSVRPHGKTRLPPGGLELNLEFEYFSKLC